MLLSARTSSACNVFIAAFKNYRQANSISFSSCQTQGSKEVSFCFRVYYSRNSPKTLGLDLDCRRLAMGARSDCTFLEL